MLFRRRNLFNLRQNNIQHAVFHLCLNLLNVNIIWKQKALVEFLVGEFTPKEAAFLLRFQLH